MAAGCPAPGSPTTAPDGELAVGARRFSGRWAGQASPRQAVFEREPDRRRQLLGCYIERGRWMPTSRAATSHHGQPVVSQGPAVRLSSI